MNLVFVSGAQYPFQGAATNRYIAYAKGLIELGHNVTFVLFLRQQTDLREFNEEGITFICSFLRLQNKDYE